MRGSDAIFGVLARDAHEHGMAAAVNADFDGIDIEFRQQFLEVGEHLSGERFAIVFFEQRGSLVSRSGV